MLWSISRLAWRLGFSTTRPRHASVKDPTWMSSLAFYTATESANAKPSSSTPSPLENVQSASSATHVSKNHCIIAGSLSSPKTSSLGHKLAFTLPHPSGGGATLENTLQKLYEQLSVYSHRLQAQGESITRLQRRQDAMEYRIADAEQVNHKSREQLVEVRRQMGEVMLKQQNTDLLLKQIEQDVSQVENTLQAGILYSPPPPPTAPIVSGEIEEQMPPPDTEINSIQESETVKEEGSAHGCGTRRDLKEVIQSIVQTTWQTWLAEHYPLFLERSQNGPPLINETMERTQRETTPSIDVLQDRIANMEQRLSEMHAGMMQHLREKGTIQHILDTACNINGGGSTKHPVKTKNPSTKFAKEVSDSASDMPREETLHPPGASFPSAELAELLRHSGALPFKDVTGLTRIASQRVLFYNVPANIGAAEIRELCVNCVGGSDNVIYCVVKRLPVSIQPMVTGLSQETGAVNTNSETVRYRSKHQLQPVCGVTHGSNTQQLQRTFEVTFASAHLAVRAIMELNGCMLKSSAQQASQPIAVVPVVAADIIAAMKRLQGAQ